jgi:hypothetical protein
MPKKHTTEDEAFIAQFSEQLRAAYEAAQRKGTTRLQFAQSLDVGSSGLQDYLDAKRMPTVRSLALAVHHYDIDVSYQGTAFRARRASLATQDQDDQMTFPFVLSSLDPRVALKLGPATENTITLGLAIKRRA